MNSIKTPAQFGSALNSPYTWPGSYPTYFATSDAGALCHRCAKANGHLITDAIRTDSDPQWRVVCQVVNWEDSDLVCDHCGEPIESAYAD